MDAERLSREGRTKQETVQAKEIRLRPGLALHEYEFKIRHARRFIEEGFRVLWTIRFGDGHDAASEAGQEVMDRIWIDLEDVATVESRPKFEGRTMTMTLAPLKQS